MLADAKQIFMDATVKVVKEPIHTKHLTHGNFDLTLEDNKDIVKKVQEFIVLSRRFP